MRVEVSHLFFADDTLIFCDASKENLRVLELGFYVVRGMFESQD